MGTSAMRMDFNGTSVRMLDEVDGPLFSLDDVASILGFSNVSATAVFYCKRPESRQIVTGRGEQLVTFVPARDVRRVAAHSRAVARREFEEWLFTEILPQYGDNI